MLVQELHFRAALVLSLSDNESEPEIRAVAGYKIPSLKSGKIQFSKQARNQLSNLPPGYCTSVDEDEELA